MRKDLPTTILAAFALFATVLSIAAIAKTGRADAQETHTAEMMGPMNEMMASMQGMMEHCEKMMDGDMGKMMSGMMGGMAKPEGMPQEEHESHHQAAK